MAAYAAQAAVQIQTKIDPGSDHKWIKPQILVLNTGTNLDLKNMSINYYFYDANFPINAISTQIYYSSLGSSGITFNFSALPETVTGANGKKANLQCQVMFSQSMVIPANSNFEFKFGFHANDWRVFNENDDWSYTTQTSYVQTTAITLIAADGTVLAGIIPGTPAIATPANAMLNTETNISAALSVLGSDNGGEPNLTYTWETMGTPPAPVTYSANGTNAAKNAIVTFYKAGSYSFRVKVKDQGNLTTTSSIAFAINTTTKTIMVDPPSVTVNLSRSYQFKATQYDQFGTPVSTQPRFTWSISPNPNPDVKVTPIAPANREATVQSLLSSSIKTYSKYTVTATANNMSGTADFVVADSVGLITMAKKHIKHLVIIMQENRTFDNYFGKYHPQKDEDGKDQQIDTIPSWFASDGTPAGITYDNGSSKTASPIHFAATSAPMYAHDYSSAQICLGTNRETKYLLPEDFIKASKDVGNRNNDEIMGYHTSDELPAYHLLADNFVLQDRMFEPAPSYSKVSHLYLFSEWSAECSGGTCVTNIQAPANGQRNPDGSVASWCSWNSLGNLISTYYPGHWAWAVFQGVGWTPETSAGCGRFDYSDNLIDIEFWNPLAYFNDTKSTYHDWSVERFFYGLARTPTYMPAVSWIVPQGNVSEHSNWSAEHSLERGHRYVATIIQEIMEHPMFWDSCAIFLAWDDWGGFYDHARPPVTADGFGYGIRVPGLLISPWARKGFVDRQTLSFDAYARFIEDVFLEGKRIPTTDKRPEERETEPKMGNLLYSFDFSHEGDPEYPGSRTVILPCGLSP
jgi:phospholipase C